MKVPRALPRYDAPAAAGLTLLTLAALCLWHPALSPRPGPAPIRPPRIRFVPDTPAGGDVRAAAVLSAARSPAVIALSAAPLWPPVRRHETESPAVPLDLAPEPVPLVAPAPQPPPGPGPALSPPRPIVPPRTAAARAPRPPPAPAFRLGVTGTLAREDLVLTPLSALEEPAGPWSFAACLSLDADGVVRHVLMESADLPPATRRTLVRALYACRRRGPGRPGDVRLTAEGPGRERRP